MTGSDASPLEHAAVSVDAEAASAFKALAHETRLAILLALWEAYDPPAADGTLSFTELCDRVGVADTGRFNYHLDPLVGRYVDATEEGYTLRRAGYSIVQTVLGGTGIEDATLEPRAIDMACPYCGAPTAVGFDDQVLYQVCTDCVGSLGRTEEGWSIDLDDDLGGLLGFFRFDPNGVADRDAGGLLEATVVKGITAIFTAVGGVCPSCSGVVEGAVDVCDDHDASDASVCSTCRRRYRIRAMNRCTTCKERFGFPPAWGLVTHPAVVSFYYDRGVRVGDVTDPGNVLRTYELVNEATATVRTRDPLEVAVTFAHDDAAIRLVVDRDLDVRAVERVD